MMGCDPTPVPETLEVDLNRGTVHAVEAPPAFEATGSFAVALRNHGEPTHVHLTLDGDLAAHAAVESTNCFVGGDSQFVDVAVGDAEPPVSGRLEVVTGYGAERTSVEVTVVDPGPETANVAVGTGSGAPRRTPTAASTDRGPLPDLPVDGALVAGFAVVALFVLVGVVATLSDPLTAGLSVLVLAGGIAAAAYLLQS
jgi:hypothetical protein